MSAFRLAAVTGLLGFWVMAPASAQGLGDTAAKEKAKRAAKAEAKKEPAKEFTNADLDKGRPPGAKPDSSGAGTAPSLSESGGASPAEAPAPAEDKVAQERSYLDAITAAQQGVTAGETKVRQLSEKLNPMSVSYIYGAGGSNDANEELARARRAARGREPAPGRAPGPGDRESEPAGRPPGSPAGVQER